MSSLCSSAIKQLVSFLIRTEDSNDSRCARGWRGPRWADDGGRAARYGVATRIIDKSAERTDKSKALVVWSRTLELMDRMGCSGGLLVPESTWSRPISRREVVRSRHVRLDTTETPYPFALMIPQSETERLMEKQLNSFGVHVERQVELVRFAPDTIRSRPR